MALPTFDELPFNSRPDLTPYLIHLTKYTQAADEYSAYENLVSILKSGEIWGSGRKKGFVKGPRKATCFTDVPFQALKYVLTPENTDPENPRYEPYGLIIKKSTAYNKGCRPVLYLSNSEIKTLNIPEDELWRVVRFEPRDEGWISWIHEREWGCSGNFKVPSKPLAALVKDTRDALKLQKQIEKESKEFKCKPSSIIPLSIICQGLLPPKPGKAHDHK
jgi:hypothetical protein